MSFSSALELLTDISWPYQPTLSIPRYGLPISSIEPEREFGQIGSEELAYLLL